MGVLSQAKESAVQRQRVAEVLKISRALWESRSSPIRTERFSFYGQGFPHETEIASSLAAVSQGLRDLSCCAPWP